MPPPGNGAAMVAPVIAPVPIAEVAPTQLQPPPLDATATVAAKGAGTSTPDAFSQRMSDVAPAATPTASARPQYLRPPAQHPLPPRQFSPYSGGGGGGGGPRSSPSPQVQFANSQPSPSPSSSSPDAGQPYHLLHDLAHMKTSDLANAIIHLYRGEMGRQVAYRVRLDTCTNWAVTITAAMTVFSLGNATVPHYFHIVVCVFIWIFLVLEARRYGYYVAIKSRVRQIESGFYGRVLMGPEFGRSMCGLIQVRQPSTLESSPAPTTTDPQFQSPFMKFRKLSNPDAVAGLAAGAVAEQDITLDEEAAPEEAHREVEREASRFPAPVGRGAASAYSVPNCMAEDDADSQIRKEVPPPPIIQPFRNDWTHLLYHNMLYPEVNLSWFDSMLTRLRRVYMLLLLGVLCSWIIKVHLVVGLKENIVLVTAVCAVYLLMAFLVWYYLPRQRSRMHAEKHVAAMFMQKRERQLSSGSLASDGSGDKKKWWQRNEAADGGLRRRAAGSSVSYSQAAPFEKHTEIPPRSIYANSPAHTPNAAPTTPEQYEMQRAAEMKFWSKQAMRNVTRGADI